MTQGKPDLRPLSPLTRRNLAVTLRSQLGEVVQPLFQLTLKAAFHRLVQLWPLHPVWLGVAADPFIRIVGESARGMIDPGIYIDRVFPPVGEGAE